MKPLILLKRVNSWRRLYSSLDADSEGKKVNTTSGLLKNLLILGQEAPIF
jgi:hypothetical protein